MGYGYDKRADQCSDGKATAPTSMNEAPSVDQHHDPIMELALAGGGQRRCSGVSWVWRRECGV